MVYHGQKVMRNNHMKIASHLINMSAALTLRLRVVLFDVDGLKRQKLQAKLNGKSLENADSEDEEAAQLDDRNEYMVVLDQWVYVGSDGQAYVVVPPVFVEVSE